MAAVEGTDEHLTTTDIEKQLKELGVTVHQQRLTGCFGGFPLSNGRIAMFKEQLRCIEKLGGSASFEKWVKDTNYGNSPTPLAQETYLTISKTPGNTFQAVQVNVWFLSVFFTVEIKVLNTPFIGEGMAWGIGTGYIGATGLMEVFGSLSSLSTVNGFRIFDSSGHGGITLLSNQTTIAIITFSGVGIGPEGVGGTGEFSFKGGA